MPKWNRSTSVTMMQNIAFQTSVAAINEKSPIVRIIFKDPELF